MMFSVSVHSSSFSFSIPHLMAMGTKYFGTVFSNDIVFTFIVDNTILKLEKTVFQT